MKPQVSICIPCFNQTEHLRLTVDSIFEQTFNDFELIISDDSITDDVEDLVTEYKEFHKDKILYYRNKPSLGSPENWNFAIGKASGALIKIMHHDDYFTSKDSLQLMVDLLFQKPEYDFAFCASSVQNLNDNCTRDHLINSDQLLKLREFPESLFLGNIIGNPSATIFRKSIFEPFNKKYKWVVDFDFYIRILKKNGHFNYTQRVLTCNVFHGNNITNVCENNINIDLKEHLELFNELTQESSSIKFNRFFIRFFVQYFAKFGITGISKLRNLGYSGSIPLTLRLIVCYTRLRFVRLKLLGKKPGVVQYIHPIND